MKSTSILALVFAVQCLPQTDCAPDGGIGLTDRQAGGQVDDWAKLRDGLRSNKQSMCSFLLMQVSDKEVELTLQRVTDLFEQALDHMAKAALYAQFIKPYIKANAIADFDNNGGSFVLEISNDRRNVISEYNEAIANGATDEERKQILEKYFYKACASKLGTVISESSMYGAMLKLEKLVKLRLHKGS